MKSMAFGCVLIFAASLLTAQEPEILDVSVVVVGPQRVETLWAYAMGKWSDAGKDVGTNSTQIQCYKRFGICEVASAYSFARQAWVNLDTFDILRWDGREMISVDSSPACTVNTLRFDFVSKRVSISSASKGETKNGLCKEVISATAHTAFLIGIKDQPNHRSSESAPSEKERQERK
jgi:hypothetical protein